METFENFVEFDLGSEIFESKIKEEGAVYYRKALPLKDVRKVTAPEIVDTYLLDGSLESSQRAEVGDWVVTGPEGEQFMFSAEKFSALYVEKDTGVFVPKDRKFMAIKNPTRAKIRIQAPWGTEACPAFQYGGPGCVLVIGLSREGQFTDDRYIIGDEMILESNYNRVMQGDY